jgi:PAS domain S-box-containing protein
VSRPPEATLQLSDSALLETLVLQAPVAFAFYDTDLRYRRINRMLADINGLPMEHHIGRRPSEVLPEPLGTAVEDRLRLVLESGEVVIDLDFEGNAPSTRQPGNYESQWFPARGPDGEVIGVAVLVLDVTDRRRHEEALRRSTERTARLQQATAGLAGALTVEQVCEVVRDLMADAVGATDVEVTLGGLRELEADVVAGPEGRPVVQLPLTVAGTLVGLLQLTTREAPDEDDRIFLSAFAGQCAIALERARLYERERSTAIALQHSLLPERLPDVPKLELAALFNPGSAEAEVGGDWYDAFTLPDDRVALVVGDVMGKGVRAAAGMGRLRSALRALAHADPSPAAVLGGLDRVFVATEGLDQIATLVYVLVDPHARTAEVACAGHLPLVIMRSGELPGLVQSDEPSTPLGLPEARRQRTLQMAPGDLLLGFTDGVVERRGTDIDEGIAEVLRLTDEPVTRAVELVERLGALMLDRPDARDDATVLAVRFTA